jgi:hypothetical protein
MIQYRNFSNASFGEFSIIAEGKPAELQLEFDNIYQQHEKAPIRLKKSSNGKTPSEYIILKNGVYRLANHWNNVGNCFWLLQGSESTQVCYKKWCIGYCAYEEMLPTFVVMSKLYNHGFENDRLLEIIERTVSGRERQEIREQRSKTTNEIESITI